MHGTTLPTALFPINTSNQSHKRKCDRRFLDLLVKLLPWPPVSRIHFTAVSLEEPLNALPSIVMLTAAVPVCVMAMGGPSKNSDWNHTPTLSNTNKNQAVTESAGVLTFAYTSVPW